MTQTKTSEEVKRIEEGYKILIPTVYPEKFPTGFTLQPTDWALTERAINRPSIEAIVKEERRMIRPIGTMDVEFLSNALVKLTKEGEIDLVKNYPCGLKCPGCFSQEEIYGDRENLMFWQDTMKIIDRGIEIGLTSLKFLGPGELFQNPDLFDILNALKERNMPLSIFTKGAELGSNDLARQIYGSQGIRSAKDLVRRVAEYGNVRILLGFNSFFSDRQDKMVGSSSVTQDYQFFNEAIVQRGVANYTSKRNQALANLVEAGFNSPEKGQRLSLIAAPVALYQIDEIPSMYVWAARRNIPLIIAPTMESGPKSIGLSLHNKKLDPNHEKLIEMMTEVYSRAIDSGILSLEQIRRGGISAYMGTSPCNQVANGLFMRLNGRIQTCPGRSDASAVYGNVHETPLAEIWANSPNYTLGPLANNWCTAKTTGMPSRIQEETLIRLEKKYSSEEEHD